MHVTTQAWRRTPALSLILVGILGASPAGAQEGMEAPVAATRARDVGAATSTMSAPRPKRWGKRKNVSGTTTPTGGKTYLGQLKQSVDRYDAEAFLNELNGVAWKGWEWSRVCKNHRRCDNGHTDGTMLIQAIGDANKVPGAAKLEGKGVVIGRMMNTGTRTDAKTQIPGNQAWPDEYYFVLERDPGNTTTILKIAIVTRDQATGKAHDDLSVYDTDPNSFRVCTPYGENHKKRNYALASFGSCATEALPDNDSDTDEVNDDSRKFRAPGDSQIDGGAWFSCGEGCCTAQAPPYSRLARFLTRGQKERRGTSSRTR